MSQPTTFGDADRDYLRNRQYADRTNLDARASLHQRFGTATLAFPDFVAAAIGWNADDRILECGSGTGLFWTNTSTPRSADVTLTDLSPGMVATAVASAEANGFEAIDGREADVQDLPFDDRSFDVVIANHMLYHVPDPDRAVAELARVVADGGTVVTATNGTGHMGELTAAVAEVFGSESGPGPTSILYERFGIDSGEARLRERFAEVTWRAFDNDLLVDDPAAAIAYCRSYPPGIDADEAQVAALTEAIERRFVDGVFRIRTRAGVFVARRPRRT